MQHTEHEIEQTRWLDEQLAELATLQEIGLQLNSKPEIDHVMQTTLDWAMHTTCAISGTISLLEQAKAHGGARPSSGQATWEAELHSHPPAPSPVQGQPVLRVIAHRGYSPGCSASAEMAQYWQTPWPAKSELAGQVVHTGETAVINDVAYASHDTDDIESTVSPRSHLVTPIKRQDRMIGLICLESTVPNGFTAAHVSFLARMADLAAIAIENAQLYEQMNQRIAELEALRKTGLELSSSRNLEAVLDSILTHSQALTGADHIAISLYDERRGLYQQKELPSAETWDHPFTPEDQDQIADGVAREVAHAGKAQVVYNNRGPSPQEDAALQMSTIASIPLIKSNGLLGVLTVSFQKTRTFTQDKVRVLHLLADQAAIAIENAQLYAEMQHAQDAKNDLISAALHEFKTPMTSIQGYAKLIALQESGPITEQQKAYLDVIQKNIQRINALIDNLIDVSSTEPGPMLRHTGNEAGRAVAVE